jgi:hypothetical protein
MNLCAHNTYTKIIQTEQDVCLKYIHFDYFQQCFTAITVLNMTRKDRYPAATKICQWVLCVSLQGALKVPGVELKEFLRLSWLQKVVLLNSQEFKVLAKWG